ncbi:hypothetical protein ScPMuIL_001885 [Solemya velum]
MGLKSMLNKLLGSQEVQVYVTGRKSHLYKMKLSDIEAALPNINFTPDPYDGHSIVPWNYGGRTRFRPLFQHYIFGADAMLFLVDCADRTQVESMRAYFDSLATSLGSTNVAMCVLAENIHQSGAMTTEELTEVLMLHEFPVCEVFPVNFEENNTLTEAMAWLCHEVSSAGLKKSLKTLLAKLQFIVTNSKESYGISADTSVAKTSTEESFVKSTREDSIDETTTADISEENTTVKNHVIIPAEFPLKHSSELAFHTRIQPEKDQRSY